MRKLNQKGFSAVEALLIIIILLLIGFIGYYVWHSQHETNKTYSSASQTAQSSSGKQATDNTNTVVLKEWGVEAPYNGPLTLSYAIGQGTDTNSAAFSSTQLTNASTDCIGRGGAIARYASDADATNLGGDGKTVAQYAGTLAKGTYAHVGDYYYFFVHDQGACGDNPNTTSSLQQQTNNAVKALVPKLKAVKS
ncbi:MAG TPA: hypothetical protein VHB72_04880 [Candidatus Saccharimonadales bacterium]|nr:hypothetical protein [Candidatus Saccharimonadales bacterium]